MCVEYSTELDTKPPGKSAVFVFASLIAIQVDTKLGNTGECTVRDLLPLPYSIICVSRLHVHQSPPTTSPGSSSGQLRGPVVKLHPSLQDGTLGRRWSGLTCWLLGLRVPGSPQPPGSPVGGQRSPVPPSQLHPCWTEALKGGPEGDLLSYLS